ERTVVEADGGDAVVVKRPTGLERLQETGDLLGQEPGDVAAEVVGVRADVAEAARGAGLLRVGTPLGLLLVGRLEPRAQPALDVTTTDGVDLAELAAEHHLAGLANERIACVVVRH